MGVQWFFDGSQVFYVYLTVVILCAMRVCNCLTTDVEDLVGVGGWWDSIIHVSIVAREAG